MARLARGAARAITVKTDVASAVDDVKCFPWAAKTLARGVQVALLAHLTFLTGIFGT